MSVADIGANASRKSDNDKSMPRAIFYIGACTVTKPNGDSEDLIPVTSYTYLPIQYTDIESADEDVFVLF